MRIQAPGKLAALTARGPAGEGLQETQKQTHVFNCMPAVDNHTLDDEIVLRAVDPAQAYHVAGYINPLIPANAPVRSNKTFAKTH